MLKANKANSLPPRQWRGAISQPKKAKQKRTTRRLINMHGGLIKNLKKKIKHLNKANKFVHYAII